MLVGIEIYSVLVNINDHKEVEKDIAVLVDQLPIASVASTLSRSNHISGEGDGITGRD